MSKILRVCSLLIQYPESVEIIESKPLHFTPTPYYRDLAVHPTIENQQTNAKLSELNQIKNVKENRD